MSLLRRDRRSDFVSEPQRTLSGLRQRSWSGITVTENDARGLAAWWAAVELVAGVGSSLPLDEIRVVGDTRTKLPLSSIFADPDPDPSITAKAFRHQLLTSAIARGNAYAEVLGSTGPGTQPTGMVAIHPDRVQWRYVEVDGRYGWHPFVDGERRSRWPLGDLWHWPLFVQAGSPVGLSPVEVHRQTIGAAIAAQKFGAQYFDSGGLPVAIIRPDRDPGEDGAKALKQKVVDATRGNREPLVLPATVGFDKLTISADEAQFLQTQRYGVEEVARIVLGGFPELIGGATSGQNVTYTNREQRLADFLALSLVPRYLAPLEDALSTLIPRGRIVRHNVDALLRGDLAARFAAYESSARIFDMTGVPVYTPDEIRAIEDLPPLDESSPVRRNVRPEPTTRSEGAHA